MNRQVLGNLESIITTLQAGSGPAERETVNAS